MTGVFSGPRHMTIGDERVHIERAVEFDAANLICELRVEKPEMTLAKHRSIASASVDTLLATLDAKFDTVLPAVWMVAIQAELSERGVEVEGAHLDDFEREGAASNIVKLLERSKPDHYKTVDPIALIKAQFTYEMQLGFLLGNVIKYAARGHMKDGLKDYLKAEDYLLHVKELMNSEAKKQQSAVRTKMRQQILGAEGEQNA